MESNIEKHLTAAQAIAALKEGKELIQIGTILGVLSNRGDGTYSYRGPYANSLLSESDMVRLVSRRHFFLA